MHDLINLLLSLVRYSAASLRLTADYLQTRASIRFGKQQVRRFMVNPHRLGLPAGLNYDNVEELIEGLEGAGHT
jgi:hypothetical protein